MTYRHGTHARYSLGPDENEVPGKGCHCGLCKAGHRVYQKRYHLQVVRLTEAGRMVGTVPAWPVRDHVRGLMDAGVSARRIGGAAGVSMTTLARLLWGIPWQGKPVAETIRARVAERLLALQLADFERPNITPIGVQRRLQGLIALGWTGMELSRRSDWCDREISRLTRGDLVCVLQSTAERAVALYDALHMIPAPESPASTLSRRRAADAGWAPPMAWDDDIDDPRARPRGVRREAA